MVVCVCARVPTGLDPSSDCIPCAAGKYVGRMKLPEVIIYGDWTCQNIAGLECPDPNNWYVLAARKQEYVCLRARALSRMTLRYEYKRLGLTGLWRRPAIADGNRRWKSKSVRTALRTQRARRARQAARNVPPEASAHQAPQPAPSARLGSTWVKEMEQS